MAAARAQLERRLALVVERPQRPAQSGGGRALRRAALYLLGEVAFLLTSSLLL